MPYKKKKKRSRSYQWTLGSFFLTLFLIYFAWQSEKSISISLPQSSAPAALYSNQCGDDLRRLFVTAIQEAKESIVLIIYSLTDQHIVQALRSKSEEGVPVTVVYDPTTAHYGIKKLGGRVKKIEKEGSGLMHQKILMIDRQKIWIGSANFTTESLRLHENLVVGLVCPELAKAIEQKHPYLATHSILPLLSKNTFRVGGQKLEFWSFPEEGKEGLQRLISLIDSAKSSLQIAMFTWTHPELTAAVIRAFGRGVSVEVIHDHQQGVGVSEKAIHALLSANIPVKMNRTTELLHHKHLYLDKKILVNGSANWTKAAFSKNDDCFLIIHDLTEEQREKMEKLWYIMRCTSEPAVAISTKDNNDPLLAA